MVLTLQELGVDDRDIYLYDTFEGMTEPTEHDVSPLDPPALETWHAAEPSDARPGASSSTRSASTRTRVRETLLATGYPAERLHFVRGPVEETLPGARARTAGAAAPRHRLVRVHAARAGAPLPAARRRRRADHRRLRPLGGRPPGRRRVLRAAAGRCCSAGSTTPAGSRSSTDAPPQRAGASRRARRPAQAITTLPASSPSRRTRGHGVAGGARRRRSRVRGCAQVVPRLVLAGALEVADRRAAPAPPPALRRRRLALQGKTKKAVHAVPARVQGQRGARPSTRLSASWSGHSSSSACATP